MLCFYIAMYRKTRGQLSAKVRDFCDIKTDVNPKSWFSRYRRTSIGYLIKMLLFYHGIGLLLMLAGTSIVKEVISNYEEPSLTRDLSLVLSAGPVEETLFFGIPYYAFGNHYVVLGGGIVWAMLHILNTHILDIRNLSLISQEGENTLIELMKEGVSFHCGGVFAKHVVREIAHRAHVQLQEVSS